MKAIIKESNFSLSFTYYDKTREFFINNNSFDVYLTKNKHKARLIRNNFFTITRLIERNIWSFQTLIIFAYKISKYSYNQLYKYFNNLSKLLK